MSPCWWGRGSGMSVWNFVARKSYFGCLSVKLLLGAIQSSFSTVWEVVCLQNGKVRDKYVHVHFSTCLNRADKWLTTVFISRKTLIWRVCYGARVALPTPIFTGLSELERPIRLIVTALYENTLEAVRPSKPRMATCFRGSEGKVWW